MFCRKCGTKNEDSDIFCAECGARLMPLPNNNASINEGVSPVVVDSNNNVSNGDQLHNMEPRVNPAVAGASARIQAAQVQSQPYEPQPTATYGNGGTSKKFPIIPIVICALLALCAIGAGVFWFTNRNTINLDKYVVTETIGYNGYGSFNVKIDSDAIEKKYGKRVVRDKYISGWLAEVIKAHTSISKSENCYGSLSNGDDVTYMIKADTDVISEYFNCKVKYSDEDVEVKIKGLEEAEEFDAFSEDILDVRFEGVSPNGSVMINNLQYQGELNFELSSESYEDDGDLSNGDSVTVCVDTSNINDFIKAHGMKPSVTERTYTVEGLDEYVKQLKDISDSDIEEMREQCKNWWMDYFQDSDETESLKKLEQMGEMMFLPSNDYPDVNNRLLIIYKATIRNKYKSGKRNYNKENCVYYYITYSNVARDSDGKLISDIEDYQAIDSWYNYDNYNVEFDSGIKVNYWDKKIWSYYGYKDIEELKEYVTEKCESENLQLVDDTLVE